MENTQKINYCLIAGGLWPLTAWIILMLLGVKVDMRTEAGATQNNIGGFVFGQTVHDIIQAFQFFPGFLLTALAPFKKVTHRGLACILYGVYSVIMFFGFILLAFFGFLPNIEWMTDL